MRPFGKSTKWKRKLTRPSDSGRKTKSWQFKVPEIWPKTRINGKMILSIRNKAAFTRAKIFRENAISVYISEVLINNLINCYSEWSADDSSMLSRAKIEHRHVNVLLMYERYKACETFKVIIKVDYNGAITNIIPITRTNCDFYFHPFLLLL